MRTIMPLGMMLILLSGCLTPTGPVRVEGGLDPAEYPQGRLAVMGLTSDVKDEAWRDERVGLGLRSILSQLFHEHGSFLLVEEKEDIRRQLEVLAAASWQTSGEAVPPPDLPETDLLAYGRILFYGKPQVSLNAGPFHARTDTVIIRLEVTLKDPATGAFRRAEAEGAASVTAGSALFTYREDGLDLSASTVGTATRKALEAAVTAILAHE